MPKNVWLKNISPENTRTFQPELRTSSFCGLLPIYNLRVQCTRLECDKKAAWREDHPAWPLKTCALRVRSYCRLWFASGILFQWSIFLSQERQSRRTSYLPKSDFCPFLIGGNTKWTLSWDDWNYVPVSVVQWSIIFHFHAIHLVIGCSYSSCCLLFFLSSELFTISQPRDFARQWVCNDDKVTLFNSRFQQKKLEWIWYVGVWERAWAITKATNERKTRVTELTWQTACVLQPGAVKLVLCSH